MHYQQPQAGPVALDIANPVALGASLLVSYGTSNENVVTGKRPDLQVGAVARYAGRYGVYDSAYSGGSGGADDKYSLPSTTDFALLAVVDYGQSSGSMASILGGDGSGNRGFQFRFDSSNNLQFIRFNTSESNVSCSVPASSRRGVVLAISVGNAISVHFGTASATNTISGTPKAATRVSLGDSFGFDPLQSASDALFMAAVLSGSVAQQNIRSLLDNPWQLLRDDEEPGDFADVPAGGAYSAGIAEQASAADACSVVVIATAGVQEIGAIAHLVGAQLSSARAMQEALVGVDAAGTSTAMTAAQAENVTSAEVVGQGGAVVATGVVESVAVSDAAGATALLVSACLEAVTASESISRLMVSVAAQVEIGGGVDICSAMSSGEAAFARAPTGSGYQPRRGEGQTRQSSGAQSRPAAIQRTFR